VAPHRACRLKQGEPPVDGITVLTKAILSALLLAIPLLASWVLVRRIGHPSADRA